MNLAFGFVAVLLVTVSTLVIGTWGLRLAIAGFVVAGFVEVAEVAEIVVSMTTGAAPLDLNLRSGRRSPIRWSRLRRHAGARQLGSRRVLRLWCRVRTLFRLGRYASTWQLGRRLRRLRCLLWATVGLPRRHRLGENYWSSGTNRS